MRPGAAAKDASARSRHLEVSGRTPKTARNGIQRLILVEITRKEVHACVEPLWTVSASGEYTSERKDPKPAAAEVDDNEQYPDGHPSDCGIAERELAAPGGCELLSLFIFRARDPASYRLPRCQRHPSSDWRPG